MYIPVLKGSLKKYIQVVYTLVASQKVLVNCIHMVVKEIVVNCINVFVGKKPWKTPLRLNKHQKVLVTHHPMYIF